MTEQLIAKLEAKGFRRWTKGKFDRLYINATHLGLSCSYYNTGNVSYAEFNGAEISNRRASKLLSYKTFINIATGDLYSDDDDLKDAAEKLIAEAEEEIANGDLAVKKQKIITFFRDIHSTFEEEGGIEIDLLAGKKYTVAESDWDGYYIHPIDGSDIKAFIPSDLQGKEFSLEEIEVVV